MNGYQHTWESDRAYQELNRQGLDWLQRACRERGLQTFQLKRADLISTLMEWENSESRTN